MTSLCLDGSLGQKYFLFWVGSSLEQKLLSNSQTERLYEKEFLIITVCFKNYLSTLKKDIEY